MKNQDLDNFRKHVEQACSALGDAGREKEAAQDKGSNLRFFAVRVPLLRRLMKSEFQYDHHEPCEWLERWDWTINHSVYYEPISLGLLFYQNPERTRVSGFFERSRKWAGCIENWGHCDLLGNSMSAYGTHSWDSLESCLQDWSQSESVWLRRLSIVSLVRYIGKSSTYLPFGTVIKFIEPHLENRDKYISRPVGWVLREHLKAEPTGEPRYYLRKKWSKLPHSARIKLQLFKTLEAKE